MKGKLRYFVLSFFSAVLAIVFVSTAIAKPPPWAPAHGYRAKHGYSNYDYDRYSPEYDRYEEDDLGIDSGKCYAEEVGAVLGGVVGAVVGSKVGDGDGRKVAVVAGTILGVIIGKRIGRSIEESDRYCTGQTLERANNGQMVSWTNPNTDVEYQVTPLNSYLRNGLPCRQFETRMVTASGRPVESLGDACRTADGVWEMAY